MAVIHKRRWSVGFVGVDCIDPCSASPYISGRMPCAPTISSDTVSLSLVQYDDRGLSFVGVDCIDPCSASPYISGRMPCAPTISSDTVSLSLVQHDDRGLSFVGAKLASPPCNSVGAHCMSPFINGSMQSTPTISSRR